MEPQLAVDARSRQLTMDRSLGSLPPALQSLTLYEYQGELVKADAKQARQFRRALDRVAVRLPAPVTGLAQLLA